MVEVILSLGSNKGLRQKNLVNAVDLISETVGKVSDISEVYLTEPWGFNAEQWFLNLALRVQTDLEAEELLEQTQEIESILGRKEKTVAGYQSREIDIDIIFYGDLIVKTERLSIPHPLMHKRRFVLLPILDIAPNFVHPLLDETIEQLYISTEDTTEVEYYCSFSQLIAMTS